MSVVSVALFEKGTKITRNSVNTRFNQLESIFPVSIVDGGTGATNVSDACYNLGCDIRKVLYKNASGTTAKISWGPQYAASLIRLGIYYGANNIQRYVEVCPTSRYTSDHTTITMSYLSPSNNLIIRTTDLDYGVYDVQVKNGRTGNICYHFSAEGSNGTTVEDMYIYEVVGYYRRGGGN